MCMFFYDYVLLSHVRWGRNDIADINIMHKIMHVGVQFTAGKDNTLQCFFPFLMCLKYLSFFTLYIYLYYHYSFVVFLCQYRKEKSAM